MAITQRAVEPGNIYHVHLGNCVEIAQFIVHTFLTARRAVFNYVDIATILVCSVIRRVQQSDDTPYAKGFDRVCVGENAQVPSFLNVVMGGVPTHGVQKVNGNPIQVVPVEKDTAQALAWVKDGTLSRALLNLKSFCQANSILLVKLEFPTYQEPSVALQLGEMFFNPEADTTIERKLRRLKYVVDGGEESASEAGEELAPLVDQGEDVVEGEAEVEQVEKVLGTYDLAEVIEYHAVSDDDQAAFIHKSVNGTFATVTAALGFLFPIFEIVLEVGTHTSLSTHFTVGSYAFLDNRSELDHLVRTCCNVLLNNKMAKPQEQESAQTAGVNQPNQSSSSNPKAGAPKDGVPTGGKPDNTASAQSKETTGAAGGNPRETEGVPKIPKAPKGFGTLKPKTD